MKSIKEGGFVRINEKPRYWDSSLGGQDPMKILYPFEGIVEKCNISTSNIGGYGFSDAYTNYELITKEILIPNYEIY